MKKIIISISLLANFMFSAELYECALSAINDSNKNFIAESGFAISEDRAVLRLNVFNNSGEVRLVDFSSGSDKKYKIISIDEKNGLGIVDGKFKASCSSSDKKDLKAVVAISGLLTNSIISPSNNIKVSGIATGETNGLINIKFNKPLSSAFLGSPILDDNGYEGIIVKISKDGYLAQCVSKYQIIELYGESFEGKRKSDAEYRESIVGKLMEFAKKATDSTIDTAVNIATYNPIKDAISLTNDKNDTQKLYNNDNNQETGTTKSILNSIGSIFK